MPHRPAPAPAARPAAGRAASTRADPAEVGARIRALRMAAGLSQDALAADAVSPSYLSRIEAGQRMPARAVLDHLASRLGCEPEFLLTGVRPDVADEITLDVRYAELALETGEPAEAEPRFRSARERAREHRMDDLAEEASWGLARALERLGRLDDAIDEYDAQRARMPEDSPRWAQAVIALCRCYREAGDLELAVELGSRALRALEALDLAGSDLGMQLTVTLLSAYYERGDVTHAAHLARSAVRRAESTGSPAARAAAAWNASLVLAGRGQLADALHLADRALALLGEGGDVRNLARLRTAHASLLTREGRPAEALAELARVHADLESGAGGAVDHGYQAVEAGRAHLALGDVGAARAAVAEALARLGRDAALERAAALALGARVAHAADDPTAARAAYREAAQLLAAVGASRRAAQLWVELAAFSEEIGDAVAARDAYRAAVACAGLAPLTPALAPPGPLTNIDVKT